MKQDGREDVHPASPEQFGDFESDGAGWKSVNLPGSLADAGFPWPSRESLIITVARIPDVPGNIGTRFPS